MRMRAEWIGHAAWLIEGKDRIVVDPFLTGNPKTDRKPASVGCDIIVVTHGHSDHFGDAIEIAKKQNATVVAIHEIAVYCESKGVKAEGMNKGGQIKVKNSTIRLVEAVHSSGLAGPKGSTIPGGSSCGAVIESGKTVYHAGDTALFSDMKLIGQLYRPDVALLPTGDRYTMGPREASWAASYLEAPLTVPMHYGTFPIIDTDPFEFEEHCKKRGLKGEVTILNPGEHLML
jgi:L-ascorbate metabolism protein UlaG (beta-lactamase superfamily)